MRRVCIKVMARFLILVYAYVVADDAPSFPHVFLSYKHAHDLCSSATALCFPALNTPVLHVSERVRVCLDVYLN